MDAQLHQSGSQSSLSQAHVERGSLQSHREIDALRCVLPWLPQRDLCAAACVSRELRTAAYQPELWKSLSLQGATSASARLAQALTQPRFSHLQHLNLEFAQPITDADLLLLAGKPLVSLNLNACQQVTDQGVTTAAKLLPNLQSFSLYWNLSCRTSQNITDTALRFISTSLPNLKSLNLTRCVRATDTGLKYVTSGCTQLEELLLYALSSFTDESLATIGRLSHLRVLDLCGMKHLTDQGLQGIACCTHLISLNLSWCVLITDQSLITVASSCHYLELLSLHGIRGVTDASMAALSASCVNTLHTLDVNGCVGIEDRSHAHLKVLFPKLTCFTVHK
ncbi:hypothetical protein CLOP_g16728 [Closterium sp. NIES-67]|nr:hypothetical protein CLOP_g16728 [Closterium sp. NIES-67]